LTLILCLLILSTLSFAAAPDRITGPIVSGQLVKLSAGVPMKAQPQFDQGAVDPSLKLSYMTLLTVPSASQRKAINQLLAQQQDPRSPQYHKWLKPEQYAERFGLSPNDIQKLTAWLTSQGFSVVRVARARNFIVFSGTAAQAESVFQTEIHNFEVGGEKHFSNITPPSLPAALSGVVTGIHGLSNFRPKSYLQHRSPKFSLPVSGGYELFLAPGDIATIYDIGAGMDGTNQTIAVMGQTDVYLSDLNDFRSGFALSTIPLPPGAGTCATDGSGLIIEPCFTTNFYYVLVNADPGVPTSSEDLTESDLDLEWSGATAPNAQIIFVNAPDPNGDGVWDSWYYAVDNDVAPVITMSYGICELGEAQFSASVPPQPPQEGTFSSDEAELAAANSEGITFMNSSGDSGAAGCDGGPPGNNPTPPYNGAVFGQAVNYPASSQYVTGVGGTSMTIAEISTDAGTYWSTSNGPTGGSAVCPNPTGPCIPEAAWNDGAEIGAFCAANPSNGNCHPTGEGQIAITNQQTFQEDWWISSTGGGPSNCIAIDGSGKCTGGFPQPAWQQGLNISGQPAVRFVPDVSLLASPDFPGYIVCSDFSCVGGIANGNFDQVGGTSASSPVFAGIVTLLNQFAVANGFPGAPGLGNINPSLYQIATYNQAASAFHAVTANDFPANPGSNQVYCQPNKPNGQPAAVVCPAAVSPATDGIIGYLSSGADATTGYNLVTGLGSVDATNLATAFGDLQVATTTSIALASSPTPPFFQGEPISFNITVTPSTATGAATLLNSNVAITDSKTPVAAGSATVSTSELPVGTNSVTASYIGIYAGSTAGTAVSVTVVAPNFTLTPTTAAFTVAPGATAGPDTITVTSTNGFVSAGGVTAVPLTYSCSGLPAESSCKFTPSGTTQSATPTVSIMTTAPSSGQLRSPFGRGNRTFLAMLLPGLFGLVFTMGSRKRAARCMRLLSFMVVLGFSTMWLASCGGGSGGGTSNPGTPAGTYPVVVNAQTAAGIKAGTAANITLTVN
jgi:subtilase family serine protease